MKKAVRDTQRLISTGLCLLCALLSFNSLGAIQAWDPTGTANSTGCFPGTWDTTTKNWTPAGTQTTVASASLVAWTSGNVALFCAGPSASASQGSCTVTVTGAITIGGIDNGKDNPSACNVTLVNGTSGSLTSSGTIIINSAGTACGSTTINIPITGTAALTAFGCGTITLGGANTYSGKTILQGANVSVSSFNSVTTPAQQTSSSLGRPSSVANGTISMGLTTGTGVLVYTGAGETTDRVIDLGGTTGGATLQNDGTGVLVFTSDFTASVAGAKTLTLQGSQTGTNTIFGKIVDSSSGATKVAKAGAGGWVLYGNNTYSGGFSINGGGGISFGHNSAFGTGTITWTANGFVQPADSAAYTIGNAMTLLAGGTATFAGNSGGVTYNGAWALGGSATVVTLSDAVNANPITVAGPISGSGALQTKVVSPGTGWIFTGTNTYSGPTTNVSGTFTIGGAGKLGSSGSYSAGISNGGTFTYSSSSTQTLSGVISGTGQLIQNGPGTLILTGNNTYGGDTTVNGGTISINGTVVTPFGGSTGTIKFAGGNLIVSADRGVGANTIVNPIKMTANTEFSGSSTAGGTRQCSFGGPITSDSGGTLTIRNTTATSIGSTNLIRFTNTFSFNHPITFTSDVAGNYCALEVWNRADLGEQAYTGLISGPGSIKRSVTSANTGGKVTFTQQNTYSGGTIFNDGEIALSNSCTGAFDAPTAGPLGVGTIIVGNDAGKLSAAGDDRNLFNHFVFTSGGRRLGFVGTNDLELSGNIDLAGQSVTFTNGINVLVTLSGTVSNGTFVKQGAGMLILTGTNTYSGNTTNGAGVLALQGSGSISNSPNIVLAAGTTLDVSGATGSSYSLASGQTLKGNGGINGTVVVASGATVAPGASIGTLYFTNAPTLSGTVSMEIDRAASPNADKLVVVTGGGGLVFDGALTVVNNGAAPQGGDSFDLFDASSFSGAFTATNLPALGSGLNWWLGNLNTAGSILVNAAPTGPSPTYTRAKGTSLKIAVTNITANISEPDSGDTATYQGLANGGVSSQGVTVTTSGGYYFYTPVNDNNDTFQYWITDSRGGVTTNTVSITVASQGGLAQSIAYDSGGVTVVFAGIPGISYDIERSATSDFSSYTVLYTTNAPPAGIFTIIDSSPLNPSGFYRTKSN